jgi:pilus assembly protein TadC
MNKYRLPFLIFVIVVFIYLTVRSFYNFSIGEDKGMSMIGGILYAGAIIYYAIDLYEFIKNKKRINN